MDIISVGEKDTPHFDYGISSCHDMFIKLHYEGQKLSEECNPFDCYNFFVTAWHLYDDWICKDPNRPKYALEKKGRTTTEMKYVIKAIKDLTNGSKHMLLKGGNYKKKVVTNTHAPMVGDWRSYFNNKPEVYVTIDNSIFSMWDIRYISIHYFSWLFDDSKAATVFPHEVQEHLQWCMIKEK